MSFTHYFLMVQTGPRGPHDKETEAIRVLPLKRAYEVFKQTSNHRDARVIQDGKKLLEHIHPDPNAKRRLKLVREVVPAAVAAEDYDIEVSDDYSDPSAVVLRIRKSLSPALKVFLDKAGVTPFKKTEGAKNILVFVNKQDFNHAKMTRTRVNEYVS